MAFSCGQDWQTVTIRPRTAPKPKPRTMEQAVTQAQRSGQAVDLEKRHFAGTNRAQTAAPKNTKRLDEETEELKHKTVSRDFAQHLIQARNAKEWTQRDLAQAINERPQIVAEYEQGKALPNGMIMQKMERALGVQLRGANAGSPLAKPPAKKAK
eukprot:TRINITY_DN8954_c0_g1_i1.p1 TRINITY_DN8954_c0_g1~~TRINITY_DN8954_c0_g1_i1.p1  ORF type:complete len:164 (+),score=29.22 TRINITY_DN8954_c0_g1_i1:28-492(+)